MNLPRRAAPLLGGASLLLHRVCLADTGNAETLASPPSATEGLLHSLFGLAVVMALIFAAGWLVKRFRPQLQSRSGLEVLGSTSVGTRERVVLVKFQDEVLLLGVAPGQVSLLKSAPALPNLPTATGAAPATFSERLRRVMKASHG